MIAVLPELNRQIIELSFQTISCTVKKSVTMLLSLRHKPTIYSKLLICKIVQELDLHCRISKLSSNEHTAQGNKETNMYSKGLP